MSWRIPIHATAFLLCDIQAAFQSQIYQFPSVVKTSQKMIKAAEVEDLDILNIPLIVTEQYPKALGKTVPELDLSFAALVQEKTKFSMYVGSVIEDLRNKDHVVLFGIESHVCILQTALDLCSAGKTVYVLADGVSSCNRQEIPIAIKRMEAKGCTITTSESVLFELLGDAQHASFKQISALIKETKQGTSESLQFLV